MYKDKNLNTEATLKAMTLAHKLLCDNIADDQGHLVYDEQFLKHLDELLEKLNETRALAEAMR